MEQFHISDASGKKIHIYDQMDALIDSEELLQYVIEQYSNELLLLKVEFVRNSSDHIDATDTTSDVSLIAIATKCLCKIPYQSIFSSTSNILIITTNSIATGRIFYN